MACHAENINAMVAMRTRHEMGSAMQSIDPSCYPDRDNLPLITSMSEYARAAATGASEDEVERRRERLRRCMKTAILYNMFYSDFEPAIEDMIRAVDSIVQERRRDTQFDAAIARCGAGARDALRLPDDPPQAALEAVARAGGIAVERAHSVYAALVAALAPARAK